MMNKPKHELVELSQTIELGKFQSFRCPDGQWATRSLFLEGYSPNEWKDKDVKPFFTVKDDDQGSFISLKRLYMEYADPTEYEFAVGVFGAYWLWENISESSYIQKFIQRWRTELDAYLYSQAIQEVKTIAGSGKGQALQAAKLLISQDWKSQGIRGKRVSDAEAKERILKEEAARPVIDLDAIRRVK